MAITINNQPQIYQPSQNIASWNVSSNHPDFVYFKVDVYNASGFNELITSLKYYPLPNYLNGAIIELSTLIDSVLRSEFKPMNITQNVRDTTDNVLAINLAITEMINVGGVLTANQTINPPRRTFWMGKLSPFEVQNVNDYYINNNNKGKILTKNKIRKVNQHFEHFLSLPIYENIVNNVSQEISYTIFNQENDNSFSAFYDDYIEYHTGFAANKYKFFNINTSYDNVKFYFGSGAPMSNYQFRFYRGTTEFDRVTYIVNENDCRETLNVYFLNSYGAWETLQLFNPYIENDYNRTNIIQSQTLLNNGVYNDFNVSNGRTIYNPNGKVINTNITSKISATSDNLDDSELFFLEDIFHSTNIYIKYKGVYLPTFLETKKHSLQPKKMNTKTNFVTLQFSIQDIL